MQTYQDCPQVLREFLSYHETIKGQSKRTVSEYYLDIRMFLRFVKLMRNELPVNTPLEDVPIKDVDLDFVRSISSTEVFDFLSFLANDRVPEGSHDDPGIGSAARARKLSAIKSFYNYLSVSTKQIKENPVKDIEFPKIRRSLPKYLTLEESTALLKAVSGPNQKRDFAILMLFLNCGIRRSELVGLNLTDVYDDRIRVVGKGNKERTVYFSVRAKLMLQLYIAERRGGEALFASSRAPYEPLTDRGIEKMISKLGKRIGMERPLYPHLMRHTFASHALNCGMELTIIQHLLGHSDPKTTLIYAEIDPIRVQYEYNRMIC